MRRVDWLMLRGMAREQRHWGRFPEALRASLGGDRLHCLDLPGTGTEHARGTPASIRGIKDDVRARWLQLKAQQPGPWGLIAISLGGMVAMRWCALTSESLPNSSSATASGTMARNPVVVVNR